MGVASSGEAGVARARPPGWRRTVLWLYVLAASLVVVGVFLQAFSIAAYVRGAGASARDLHVSGGFITHNIEIVVFLLARSSASGVHGGLSRSHSCYR